MCCSITPAASAMCARGRTQMGGALIASPTVYALVFVSRAGARRARDSRNHLALSEDHGQAVVSFQHDAHGGSSSSKPGVSVCAGGHDILNQAVRVHDARLVHDVLAARAGGPPMPTARSGRTSSSALLSSSFENANPRGGGQAGARRATSASGAPPSRESGGEGAWETEKGTMDMGGSRAAAEETREGESWFRLDRGLLDRQKPSRRPRDGVHENASFPREPRKRFSASAQRCARLTEVTHTGRVASVSRRSDRSRTQSPC